MPRVEEFSPLVKAEVEAARRAPEPQEDRGPMGLLKRLTTGLSRREEEPARLQPAQPREPKLRQQPEARRLPARIRSSTRLGVASSTSTAASLHRPVRRTTTSSRSRPFLRRQAN